MNRKLMSLVFLILGFLALFIVFITFFLGKTGKILITGNQNDYKVTLINQNNGDKIIYNCSGNCELDKLLMVDYSLEITSNGFKPYIDVISLNKEVLRINLALEKKISLKEVEKETSNISKITKIRAKKLTSISVDSFENNDYIYSANFNDKKLLIYRIENGNTQEIYSLNSNGKSGKFIEITGTNNVIFIDENSKYIIDGTDVYKFNLDAEISFVKEVNNKKYALHTNKGIFIFDKGTKTLEYFSLFDDFFYNSDGNYVALLKRSSSDLRERFGFDDFANIIAIYNPKTKEAKGLYKTDLDIVNIYGKGKDVYLVSDRGNIYKLIH